MRRTAILRFSDSEEISTVEAHRWVIETQGGFVWWAWWKKEKEDPALDLLKKLQSDVESRTRSQTSPLRIGLINRKGEEGYYAASCVEIRYTEDGSRMSSPDAAITPKYYRDDVFPAWFKFRQIDKLFLPAFIDEFVAVPTIDPTLYEVIWDADGEKAQVLPGEKWSMEPVDTFGEAILHISDLHFGEFHGFPLTPASSAEDELAGRPLWEVISTSIKKDLALPIGVVVISGDLISKGNGASYPDASHFIVRLLKELGLERRHCIIVPGNHDMWTLNRDQPTRRYLHEEPYREFVDAFFGEQFRSLERVRRYRTPNGRDLVFIELNSARIRSDDLKEYGFVAKHRYEQLLKYVSNTLRLDPPKELPILFAVLHHHVMPVNAVEIPDEERPVSLCLDAGELLDEFQRYGVHFVLHGHQHAPFIGRVAPFRVFCDNASPSDRPVHIIGCGSSGGRRDILPRGLEWNTLGIYTPKPDRLDLVIERYTERAPPRIYRQLTLPVVPWDPPQI